MSDPFGRLGHGDRDGIAQRTDRLLQIILGPLVPDRVPERREGPIERIGDVSRGVLQLALALLRRFASGTALLLVPLGDVAPPRREPLADLVPCLVRAGHRDPSVRSGYPTPSLEAPPVKEGRPRTPLG
jgi:hypothetical protein